MVLKHTVLIGYDHRQKQPKDQVIILMGSKMTGTDQLKPLVIGSLKKIRSLKSFGFSTLCSYIHSKKGWMNGITWFDWITAFNERMNIGGRKLVFKGNFEFKYC